MQSLQNTIQTIARQMRELSPTAKLLIGSLMVILVMVLLLVAMFTSRAAMEPLGLHATVSNEARVRAVGYLKARNIPYRERGSDILVPPNQKYAILAQLTDGQIITPDQINFDTLVQQDSPFLSKSQNDRRWLVATMNVLEQTISGFSGISKARVVIDEPRNSGGIGRAHLPASASVIVHTRGGVEGGLDQAKVDAIAGLVAGAHASLRVQDVVVVDATTGRRHRTRPDEGSTPTTNMELQRNAEREAQAKIADALAYIPGVNVAVRVVVDTRAITEQRRSFDEPKLGVLHESSRSTTSQNQTSAAESGMRPNTGASITAGGRRGSSMTDERSEAAMAPAFGGTDSKIVDPRGHALQINASIGVPRGYFVRLYQDLQGETAGTPDAAALDALIETETARIRSQIEPLIDTRAVDGAIAGTVMVSMIPDFAMPLAVGTAAGFASGDGGGGFFSGDGLVSDGLVKYVGLSALAIVSLAMMFLMVRRASAHPELPTAQELVGAPPSLGVGEMDVMGEAGETAASLLGIEIGEDDLRRKQMLAQLNEMARKTPSEAATLLRRWIKSET